MKVQAVTFLAVEHPIPGPLLSRCLQSPIFVGASLWRLVQLWTRTGCQGSKARVEPVLEEATKRSLCIGCLVACAANEAALRDRRRSLGCPETEFSCLKAGSWTSLRALPLSLLVANLAKDSSKKIVFPKQQDYASKAKTDFTFFEVSASYLGSF